MCPTWAEQPCNRYWNTFFCDFSRSIALSRSHDQFLLFFTNVIQWAWLSDYEIPRIVQSTLLIQIRIIPRKLKIQRALAWCEGWLEFFPWVGASQKGFMWCFNVRIVLIASILKWMMSVFIGFFNPPTVKPFRLTYLAKGGGGGGWGGCHPFLKS